jgi:putative sterol carrier protein
MCAIGSRSLPIAELTYTTSAETTDDVIGRDLIMMRTHRVWFALTITTILATLCSSALRGADSSTPQEVFDGMKQSFRADKAKGVHAKYQWELSGPNGGEWWIEVNDGTFKMGRGKIDNPSVTFITSDNDWVAMSNGKLKGTWAFMTGRLKVRGSQSIARKLDEIFP